MLRNRFIERNKSQEKKKHVNPDISGEHSTGVFPGNDVV